MAKIVKLASLLPEDIDFEMPGGERFRLPGDPPLALVLKIAALFERSANADETEEAEDVGLDVLRELDDEVIKLLQMRDSSITSSPFGVIGIQHVVAKLLEIYNFTAEEPDRPPARRAAPKRKSTRSTGSRSS